MQKFISIIVLGTSLIFFAACPDRGKDDSAADSAGAPETAAPAPITEDNAIEAADEVLQDIDNL